MSEDGLSSGEEEAEKGFRQGGLTGGGNDASGLAHRFMEGVGNQDAAFVKDEGPGSEHGTGVAALGELESLADILAQDKLVLEGPGETGTFDGLLGGDAIGRVPGVGDGDAVDGR